MQDERPARRTSYRDLQVWQRSRDFVSAIDQVLLQFPKYEVYGLASQMRNAAGSIPANIAEGRGRMHAGEFVHFLRYAAGSLAELETHCDIALGRAYINQQQYQELMSEAEEIGKMLYTLIARIRSGKHLQTDPNPGTGSGR